MPLFPHLSAGFVHVPKTGGQTVEAVLGCSYTTDDLYGLDGDIELSHLTAAQMLSRVPRPGFLFGFVRNPWDRLVSSYAYCGGVAAYLPGPCPTFDEYVRAVCEVDTGKLTHTAAAHVVPQAEYLLRDDDTPLVDFVGRFESFEVDLHRVASVLGVAVEIVPRVNASSHDHYASYYTPETSAMAGTRYARDAKVFGYSPPV